MSNNKSRSVFEQLLEEYSRQFIQEIAQEVARYVIKELENDNLLSLWEGKDSKWTQESTITSE